MKFKGTLQPEDFLSAQWLHIKPRRSFATVGVFLLALMLWALWFSFFSGRQLQAGWEGWLIIGVLSYSLFIFFIYIPLKIRRNYRQRKELRKEFIFVATDNSLNVEFENGHYIQAWTDYLKWKEGRNLFLLYHSDNRYQAIPKRFFHSAGDIDVFREMLQEKVKRN